VPKQFTISCSGDLKLDVAIRSDNTGYYFGVPQIAAPGSLHPSSARPRATASNFVNVNVCVETAKLPATKVSTVEHVDRKEEVEKRLCIFMNSQRIFRRRSYKASLRRDVMLARYAARCPPWHVCD